MHFGKCKKQKFFKISCFPSICKPIFLKHWQRFTYDLFLCKEDTSIEQSCGCAFSLHVVRVLCAFVYGMQTLCISLIDTSDSSYVECMVAQIVDKFQTWYCVSTLYSSEATIVHMLHPTKLEHAWKTPYVQPLFQALHESTILTHEQ